MTDVRWYIPYDGRPARAGALGEKLFASLRAHGQALYVSPDGGKTLRRAGLIAAAGDAPPDEREPLIVSEQEFARDWRPAGRAAPGTPPKAMRAGGAR